jgi:hypothetical protein
MGHSGDRRPGLRLSMLAAAAALLLPARAAAEALSLPSGCRFVPLFSPGSAGAPPAADGTAAGTCFLEPPNVDHDLLIPNGPATCTGGLPPGKVPTPLPTGATSHGRSGHSPACGPAHFIWIIPDENERPAGK